MTTFPLTPVDYIFTGIGSQPITFAFSYQAKLDADVLKNSLHQTLEHFPILSSQLQSISETDFEYQIKEDGLSFEVAESNLVFDESNKIEQYIQPVDSVEGEPLTKIVLTQTPKGSVFAVSISHALVDGFSYFHFLSSWARICRSDNFLPPYLQRNILSTTVNRSSKTVKANDIYSDCGLFYDDKRSSLQSGASHHKPVFISDETIKSHLTNAKQQHNISFSENDVITAILWKKYIPMWFKEKDNPMTYMTCPFDFRRVFTNFPKNYFGCALCFATSAIDYENLLEASPGDLAVLIRNSVSKIKDEAILNSLNTLENFRKQNGFAALENIHLRHPRHGMIVTNLTRLPIRDLDFGFGEPVDFSTFVEVMSSAAILPAQNGVEILVAHPYIGN